MDTIEKTVENITVWMKQEVLDARFSDVIVAVSGGIDSAVALALSIRAFGKEHVYAVRLPYGRLSSNDTKDAKLVTRSLGLSKDHVFQRDIYKAVNRIFSMIPDLNNTQSQRDEEMRKGNIMARVRMTFLYDLAKTIPALVVGTENKSEYLLGYFTRFGDEASDLEPIRNLYKTQIVLLAKYLGIPEEIITKVPSAGLWVGQSDEKEFGFSYKDADKILYKYIDEKVPEKLLTDSGIPKEVVGKVMKRLKANEFKHHTPKVFMMKNEGFR